MKQSKLSPFEAYYGRKPHTSITNATKKPNKNYLSWTNTLKYYLDDSVIGDEELLTDKRLYNEGLHNNAEVQEAKR